MKINNIQSYNNTQTFTALRFKSDSHKYISTLPDKVLNKLDSVGEFLADTKYYNLDIGNSFYISHINGDKFYPPLTFSNAGICLIMKFRQGAALISKKLKYNKPSEVQKVCEDIKNAPTQIERTAVIVKYLDDYEKELASKNPEVIINAFDSRETKIEKLHKKYDI